jgi:Zn ribbon nucleic-acid-binding protein
MFMGRNVMGQNLCEANSHGASCPWCKLSLGKLSMGRDVHGVKCLRCKMSMVQNVCGAMSVGRNVHRVSCPWGELYMGRNVMGRVIMGELSKGRVANGACCPQLALS